VVALENAVIDYVADLGLAASGSREAPGVYVDGAKLASIGLRIRRGASYHGMSVNVSLDTEPFGRINVCGHQGLTVTRLVDHGIGLDVDAVARGMTPYLVRRLCCRERERDRERDRDMDRDRDRDRDRDMDRDLHTDRDSDRDMAISTELQAVNS
jgi:lipoate-protein ligase B